MPTVLYIGSGVPWQGGAGYLVRQSMFLRALAEVAGDGSLQLAMFDHPADAPPPPFPARVTRLTLPGPLPTTTFNRTWADLFGSVPRMFRGGDYSAARSAVAALNPASFDFVFSFRIDFAHFAGLLFRDDLRNKLLLDVDDPEHIRTRRRMETLDDGIDWRTARDLVNLQRFEFAAVSSAKTAFVCQTEDSLAFPQPRPVVVPNCVDVPAAPARNATEPRLIFVGNCAGGAQSPNVDAVDWFLSEVWPLVLKDVPEAKFDLIGRANDTLAKQVSETPGARVAGFVDRLDSAYASASISIAPIRFGTGTRIKIIEAMAHACPVVSTPMGADGIDAADGKNISIAEEALAFAAACVRLLRDSALAEQIGRGGFALASERYNRAAEHDRLVEILGNHR